MTYLLFPSHIHTHLFLFCKKRVQHQCCTVLSHLGHAKIIGSNNILYLLVHDEKKITEKPFAKDAPNKGNLSIVWDQNTCTACDWCWLTTLSLKEAKGWFLSTGHAISSTPKLKTFRKQGSPQALLGNSILSKHKQWLCPETRHHPHLCI